jgi:hypothetical protein
MTRKEEAIGRELAKRVADAAEGCEVTRRAGYHLYEQVRSWNEAQGILTTAEDEALWEYTKALGEYRKWKESYG